MKKGFVLIETIIVVLVVVVSMLGLFKAYSFVFQKLKQNLYYENINDIYKINVLKKAFIRGKPVLTGGMVKFNKASCSIYMSSDCENLFDLLEITNIIFITKDSNFIMESNTISNTDKAYIQTLQNNHDYLIINYNMDSKEYYASLEYGGDL